MKIYSGLEELLYRRFLGDNPFANHLYQRLVNKSKRKPSSRTTGTGRQYKKSYKPRTKSTMNNSSRREVSPSTEPPALNGAKSGQRKGWLKKIFS